jgi:hypothetical protein
MVRVCTAFFIAATLFAPRETPAEPVVKETREGGISVIRIASTNGAETVYRIDLSQHHSPATVKNDLLKRWESYHFGAFVCYNTNQFSGNEVCNAIDPRIYNPQHLDVAGWVKAFKDAGMKYAVLTTLHTSGFLLWDSATTDFDVASSGNTTDVCREFVKECRRQGLVPAFYYTARVQVCPFGLNDVPAGQHYGSTEVSQPRGASMTFVIGADSDRREMQKSAEPRGRKCFRLG